MVTVTVPVVLDVVVVIFEAVVVEAELVVDVVLVEQDVNIITATNKKLKPNQINFFFNALLLLFQGTLLRNDFPCYLCFVRNKL